jgi:Predicted membrane protein
MNRKEFMLQLEQLLQDIPKEEREEAIAYYHGYFEDAGEENEEKIIQELVSPGQVAKIIKADMGLDDAMEYTEHGYQDQRFSQRAEVGTPKEQEEQQQESGYQNQDYGYQRESNGGSAFRILLIVIAALLTCPIWLPLGAGILGVAFGAIITVFALAVVFLVLVVAFYIASFACIGIGISQIVVGAFAIGLAAAGTGCILFAVAVLGTLINGWVFGKFVPWFFRGVVSLCSRLFQGRKRRMA